VLKTVFCLAGSPRFRVLDPPVDPRTSVVARAARSVAIDSMEALGLLPADGDGASLWIL